MISFLTLLRFNHRMSAQTSQTIIVSVLALNLFGFCLYGFDKWSAMRGFRRISERTLLMTALVGGSLGAVIAQQVFRHKTRKQPFRTQLALIVALHVIIGFLWIIRPDLFGAALRHG